MATLASRLADVVGAIRDKFNAIAPRLVATGGTAGQLLRKASSTANDFAWADQFAALAFVIDGGGAAITTGLKGYIEVPADCTIQAATLLADQSGSVVVDVWRCTYAQFAPGSRPVASDKITASAPPTISSAAKSQDATLTGWTKTLSKGDVLAFNVNSASTVQRVTLSLRVLRT